MFPMTSQSVRDQAMDDLRAIQPTTILGMRLKEAMLLRDMTQGEVEAAAGVGDSLVGKYLHGKRKKIQHETLVKFAGALRVPPMWLVGLAALDSSISGEMQTVAAPALAPRAPPTPVQPLRRSK